MHLDEALDTAWGRHPSPGPRATGHASPRAGTLPSRRWGGRDGHGPPSGAPDARVAGLRREASQSARDRAIPPGATVAALTSAAGCAAGRATRGGRAMRRRTCYSVAALGSLPLCQQSAAAGLLLREPRPARSSPAARIVSGMSHTYAIELLRVRPSRSKPAAIAAASLPGGGARGQRIHRRNLGRARPAPRGVVVDMTSDYSHWS